MLLVFPQCGAALRREKARVKGFYLLQSLLHIQTADFVKPIFQNAVCGYSHFTEGKGSGWLHRMPETLVAVRAGWRFLSP